MKKNIITMLILLFSTSAISGELEIIAEDYLATFQRKKLDIAAKKLHCPESYSKQELDKDHKSIAKTLSIFIEEFGALNDYKVSKNNLYVAAMTACGTSKYWEANKPITQLVYETRNVNNTQGYIVFSFSRVNKRYVLAFVHHGLPRLGDSSVNKIKHVLKRLSDKNT